MKGMATCKVCGRDFPLMKEDHYVAHEPLKKGAFAALVDDATQHEYDVFDCPHCGCQYIAQERKVYAEDEEQEAEEDVPEYTGSCEDCKHDYKSAGEEPCVNCVHGVINSKDAKDNFEPKEDK